MDLQQAKKVALEYFQRAYEAQMMGDLDEAIRLYSRSIQTCPTAEAYTFLGWSFSFKGDYEKAIQFCRKAIEVDPDFGNPYNDIGAYLIELGKLNDAVPWLKKAMTAERYEPRHYPHFNLGRIFEHQGKWVEAMEQYKKALDLYPDYALAKESYQQLQARLN